MSYRGSDSELAAMISPTSPKQQLDDVAENIIKGFDETAIVQVLNHLSQEDEKQEMLEGWRHSSSHLNLLQLAVFHGRTLVIKYLCSQHRNLMKKSLYKQKPSPQDHLSLFMDHQREPVEHPSQSVSGARRKTCVWHKGNFCRQLRVGLGFKKELALLQKAEEFQEDVGNVVNHPLHMACWLGDLNSLKALTKLFIDMVHRRRFHKQRWESSAEEILVMSTELMLQPLMKTVSLITSEVSLRKEPVKGLPLELAMDSGNIGCVMFILHSILLHWVSCQYSSLPMEITHTAVILDVACSLGAVRLVAMLLLSLPEQLLHCRDSQGQTPLHFAVWSGDTDTIRLLLEHGADVNARTGSGSTCLHLLFRYKMMPDMLEANTKLLLQYGADLTAAKESKTPLLALVEEIVGFKGHEKISAESIGLYVRPSWQTAPKWSVTNCLQALVSCVRLLLEAGADVSVVYGSGEGQCLFCRPNFLERSYPDILFSLLSTLLEFGVTICETADRDHVDHFLRSRIPNMENNGPVQASFVRLFSENGIDPDYVAASLLDSLQTVKTPHKFWRPHLWICLANRASMGGLQTLSTIFSLHLDFDMDSSQVVSAVYGSPVRSLRHSCKVAVWKALQHQGRRVDSLRVPEMVKSYLRSDDS